MSGICGLFNLDNAPVADAELRAMTSMLERRGPEGTHQWRDGATGLGHTLLATTPELRFERQPFRHAETGCVITADVRLDNRDELLGALDLSQRSDSIGDAELILVTYLEWGEDCLDRILGDFAFVIWDPRHKNLFCARDQFGLRPFYYHYAAGQRFLFASSPRSILVLPQVPYRINEGRIADFLVPQLEWIDYTSTFFEHVYRLPPGHKITVTPAGFGLSEYWKPAPGPELRPMSDEDYAQGFLEVFTRSVEARLRVPQGAVGSMLSGGMDSGSVVAVAKDILAARGDDPLRTYSATRREFADCPESKAIHAAVGMPSIFPTLVYPDGRENTISNVVSGNEEPFDGQFMFLKAVYRAAHDKDQSVVLDGAAGDIVLNEGSYIARLMRQGRFRLAMNEIAGENKFWGGGELGLLLYRYLRAAFTPQPIRKMLRGVLHRHRNKGFIRQSLISPDFARSVDIEDRFEQMRQTFPPGRSNDFAIERCDLIRPNMTAGRERYARIASTFGAEARDPFLDKRVVDYCSRLPGRMLMKNGWQKIILRNLMANRLPDEVRWCRGKPHLGWLFNEQVTKQAFDRGELGLTRLQETLHHYVADTTLSEVWRTFLEGGDAEHIHSAHSLSVWLRENETRPVVLDR